MSDEQTSSEVAYQPWVKRISKLFNTAPQTRNDISALLKLAKENKLLGDDEYAAIEGAMEVQDIQVRDVMVPRNQMVIIAHDETPEEFLPRIIESGHSRFPVSGDDSDDIIGVLHTKSLLPLIIQKETSEFNIHAFLRPSLKVPESKRLNKLMDEFRSSHTHMAIVFDEYGAVAGLVTIEDVLEEIVGEIEDEFDVDDDHDIKKLSNNDYIIKAQTTIEDFNEALEANLDDSDVDTIGGLVGHLLGHIPQRGETLVIDNFTFKVLHADSRRVHLLRLLITQPLSWKNNLLSTTSLPLPQAA